MVLEELRKNGECLVRPSVLPAVVCARPADRGAGRAAATGQLLPGTEACPSRGCELCPRPDQLLCPALLVALRDPALPLQADLAVQGREGSTEKSLSVDCLGSRREL